MGKVSYSADIPLLGGLVPFALLLDVSLQFLLHPKTVSFTHESFPSNRSSRRQIVGFLTVVFQVTRCHLSPNLQPGGSVRLIYIPPHHPGSRVAYPNHQTRSSNFRRFLRPPWTSLVLVLLPATT